MDCKVVHNFIFCLPAGFSEFKVTSDSDFLDDIDLSDDDGANSESSDFTEFEPVPRKSSMDQLSKPKKLITDHLDPGTDHDKWPEMPQFIFTQFNF